MVAKITLLLCAYWIGLVGCSSNSNVPACSKDKSVSINWTPPRQLEGTFSLKVFISDDGLKWTKVAEEMSNEINSNGKWMKVDTCVATYWYAEMQDNFGHCSQQGSCIGKLCRSFNLPDCER